MLSNSAGVGGCRSDSGATMGTGASVAGSVIADPTSTQRMCHIEERLGRSTDVGCAAMPQQDQFVRATSRTDIVGVQGATVGCREIGLEHDRLPGFGATRDGALQSYGQA